MANSTGNKTTNRSSQTKTNTANKSTGTRKASTANGSSKSSGTRSTQRKNTAPKPVERSEKGLTKAEIKAIQRRNTLIKEIVFLVILACSMLLFVACFSPALAWLKTFSFNVFGILMYVAPFIIVGIALLLVFNDVNWTMLLRFIGMFLILFAVSGMISVASAPEKGGLLGKACYAMFFKSCGAVGTYIIDAFILMIGFVLSTGFSISEFLGTVRQDMKDKEESISKRNARIERQKRLEVVRQERLEKQEHELENVETLRRANDALQIRNKAREKSLNDDSKRFKPVYGIGDTTIRENDGPAVTNMTDDASALEKNEKLFRESTKNAKETTPAKKETRVSGLGVPETVITPNFGNYSNSGNVKPAAVDTAKDVASFIPDIVVPASYFKDDDAKAVVLTGRNLDDPEMIDLTMEPGHIDLAKESGYDLGEDDQYTKTVITGSGKIIRAETDGDILKKKEIIHGGLNKADLNASSSEEHATKNTAKENRAAAAEIENTIQQAEEKEYVFPPIDLLKRGNASSISKSELSQELQETAQKLQQTLQTFGVGVQITNITCGPTVTCYEIQPEMGVKVSKIVSLTDDIKLNLAAADIRIEAPIPGKSAIGIEIPNKVKQSVVLRDLLESEEFKTSKSGLAFAAGRDIEGRSIIANIEKMPHVLVAGSTGSGKSVCINSMIMSILYHADPSEVKMIMVDPKVVELSVYNGIPHLLLPVVTDPKKAAAALNWAVAEMENRYLQFAEYNVRNIEGFNDMIYRDAPEKNGNPVKRMAKILIIVDELADLMMVAASEVETAICRLAQKARAAGIHLVLATQRPSVDVITGLIKANIPSRIAFAVSSGTDSRTILDTVGAEKLLGMGDMLYAPAGSSKPTRLQGTYVSDNEIVKVVDFLKEQGPVKGGGVKEDVDLASPAAMGGGGTAGGNDVDEYFADAGRLVIEKQKASIGMLQRAFKLGFNRAARIVDQLCDAGVVGEEEGTKPRRVLMNMMEFEDYLQNGKG